MTYGGSEFIKMILKNNKITCIFFYLCWAGGKINRPGQLAPGGEDSQGGGKISQHKGGKINCYTGPELTYEEKIRVPPPWLGMRYVYPMHILC